MLTSFFPRNLSRADLIVHMVTCSNNAATCCIKLKQWSEAKQFAQNALILLDALYSKRGKKIHTLLNKEGMIDAKLFGEWKVKSYIIVARSCIEEGEIPEAIGILKKAKSVAIEYFDAMQQPEKENNVQDSIFKPSAALKKASLKTLTLQTKEIRKLLLECSNKKKADKQMERKRAKAMFGGDKEEKENITPQQIKSKQDKQKEAKAITVEKSVDSNKAAAADSSPITSPKLERKSSLNGKPNKGDSLKKAVSFSKLPPEVSEYEVDDDTVPWYEEHKEALILVAMAGLSALTFMALRRSSR